MLRLYPLVKAHLQSANEALTERDERTNEIRRIIGMTIKLLNHAVQVDDRTRSNVIDFGEARRRYRTNTEV